VKIAFTLLHYLFDARQWVQNDLLWLWKDDFASTTYSREAELQSSQNDHAIIHISGIRLAFSMA
jgi:hypothetical protein